MSDNFNNEHDENDISSENLYSSQYEKEQLAGLEENAPQLNAPVDRSVNKKAIAFIIAAGFGLAGLGALAYHQFSGEEEAPPPERPQLVTVPDLPPPEIQIEEKSPIDVTEEKKVEPEIQVMSDEPVVTNKTIVDEPIPPVVTPVQTPTPPIDMYGTMNSKFIEDGDVAQKIQEEVLLRLMQFVICIIGINFFYRVHICVVF